MVSVRKDQGRRWLDDHLVPEGVPLRFEIASVGVRFGALLIDIVMTHVTAVLLPILLFWAGLLSPYALATLIVLLLFFVRLAYYVFAELIWNGRTLGKRICGLRVISADGTRLTPYQITVRNLMREAELFLPITLLAAWPSYVWPVELFFMLWGLGVLIFPFTNAARQRLGDILAGTIVIERPRPVMLPDLSQTTGQDAAGTFHFDPTHLEIYGRYELQVLEDILRHPPITRKDREKRHDIAQAIIEKVSYPDRVLHDEASDFLLAFYTQQRAFLENRQLLGDIREDKHRTERAPAP